MTNQILHGDCLVRLKELPDNSVDSVVTDPPYGLSKEPDITEVLTKWIAGEPYDHNHKGFMGKEWDSFVPHPDIWKEVFRALKPGGHALVFAGTRTQDLMTISLRLAGFEVRDVIEWIYFSGFPKGHDIGKAFDRRAGVKREVVAISKNNRNRSNHIHVALRNIGSNAQITEPATELARKWDGWGTTLKPAHEPIIVVRKPFKGTVADNVERYGTSAINVDASRIDGDMSEHLRKDHEVKGEGTGYGVQGWFKKGEPHEQGRFPANCITLVSDEFYSKYFNVSPQELSKKASKKDRNSDWQGNEIEIPNNHPTVKPLDLMEWLIRLVTPSGGVTLDPFMGSGSTPTAAKRGGFGFIGIDQKEEYVEIAEARTGETRTDEKELQPI